MLSFIIDFEFEVIYRKCRPFVIHTKITLIFHHWVNQIWSIIHHILILHTKIIHTKLIHHIPWFSDHSDPQVLDDDDAKEAEEWSAEDPMVSVSVLMWIYNGALSTNVMLPCLINRSPLYISIVYIFAWLFWIIFWHNQRVDEGKLPNLPPKSIWGVGSSSTMCSQYILFVSICGPVFWRYPPKIMVNQYFPYQIGKLRCISHFEIHF